MKVLRILSLFRISETVLKIGIFTPYVRNEITLAAVQFADWLYKCGISVSIIAKGRIERGIHQFWDTQVKRAGEQSVYKWAYSSTHLIWFAADFKALQQSHLVTFNNKKQKTKNIFVPNWTNWTEQDDAFLAQCDKTICLNRDMYLWLKKLRSVEKLFMSDRLHCCIVSSENVLIPKAAKQKNDCVSLLVFMPKQFELDIKPSFFDIFQKLLLSHADLKITFLSEKSLSSRYKTKLKKLIKTFESRVSFVYSLPYYEYGQLAKKVDWIYVANTRHAFGSIFNLFAASTSPVICQAIPPATAFVGNHVNGLLVPCPAMQNPYPIANIDLTQVETTLNRAVANSEKFLKPLQLSGVSLLLQKQKAFERFIYRTIVEIES